MNRPSTPADADARPRGRGANWARAAALIVFAALAASRAGAHPFSLSEFWVIFHAAGTYEIDFLYDLDALIWGSPRDLLSPAQLDWRNTLPPEEKERRLADARKYFARFTSVSFDGKEVAPRVVFPELDPGVADRDAATTETVPLALPGAKIQLLGPVPEGAREFQFRVSRAMGAIVLRARSETGSQEFIEAVGAGAASTPLRLADLARAEPSRAAAAWNYLKLGFLHILPAGVDHVAFVLGLFLLSASLGPLLWQVTAFTLAHSLTLALSIYGVISLPRSVVEPLIALSIAFIAVENLMTTELKPWRPAVVFAFGLLHGLGFAGALLELGLPRRDFLTAVVMFNAGVEAGQLAIIAGAFLLVGWMRKMPWYRARIALPLSGLIAALGVYWMIRALWP